MASVVLNHLLTTEISFLQILSLGVSIAVALKQQLEAATYQAEKLFFSFSLLPQIKNK